MNNALTLERTARTVTSVSSPTVPPRVRERIAVVGSGVSGLTAAYILAGQHKVALFEAEGRLGGHAHTHDVRVGSGGEGAAATLPVDSGFIVHNDRTYPLLQRLFRELHIETRPTEMSMSITSERTGLEYAGGRGVRGFLARPRQLLGRDYVGMLLQVRTFHRLARELLDSPEAAGGIRPVTFGEFIERGGFSTSFVELYAIPLVACVWSTGTDKSLDYPARYLFTFLDHHGMLSVGDSPQWRTVVGGSRTYVEAIAARLGDVRRSCAVTGVARDSDGVTVTTASGQERFDRIVIATHADTALALLVDPSPQEKEVLGAFSYSRNETVLHRDPSLLPAARQARASWNYRIVSDAAPGDRAPSRAPIVTYWMNRLQGLPGAHPLFVTLNASDRIDPSAVIAVMDYTHPIYDVDSVSAQSQLPSLSGGRTAFAGAYHGWGFHEDGCRSGVAAAAALGVSW